jgi:hypothetical protein
MAAPVAAMRFILTCAVGLSAIAAAPAAFPGPMSLHEAFMGGHLADRPTGPPTARYQTDEGNVFILDRSSSKTMLKFENNPEIWGLQPAHGPRGDIIYRNDLGEEMLRATSLGGITVFTERRPEGSAAAYDGASAPLRIGVISPAALARQFYEQSVRASRFGRHIIAFETGKDADPATAGEIADAAQVTGEAIAAVAARPNGRLLLTRFDDVVITEGGKPNAVMQKNRLIVIIVPKDGVFGRPSSRRIERAVGAP